MSFNLQISLVFPQSCFVAIGDKDAFRQVGTPDHTDVKYVILILDFWPDGVIGIFVCPLFSTKCLDAILKALSADHTVTGSISLVLVV